MASRKIEIEIKALVSGTLGPRLVDGLHRESRGDNMQTAIVTGGNSGLGYECARAIAAASSQWQVVIASRDHAKSNEAARSLATETENQYVVAMDLDLGSLASVRRFAADFALDAMPPLK